MFATNQESIFFELQRAIVSARATFSTSGSVKLCINLATLTAGDYKSAILLSHG
jgi:hypothetical protein